MSNQIYAYDNEIITIPDSITSIGDGTFRGCRGLKAVYYKGTAEQ